MLVTLVQSRYLSSVHKSSHVIDITYIEVNMHLCKLRKLKTVKKVDFDIWSPMGLWSCQFVSVLHMQGSAVKLAIINM